MGSCCCLLWDNFNLYNHRILHPSPYQQLMFLGFMSLLLVVTENSVCKICIPTDVADIMLPCRQPVESLSPKTQSYEHFASKIHANLSFVDELSENILWNQPNRRLDDDDEAAAPNNDAEAISDPCTSKGKVGLISKDGIQQLRIFIFVLAVMQIVYSVLTMALGQAKMRRWKAWEKETQTIEYLVANDPHRFRLTRQTTFGRRHVNSCTETSVQLWIKCFLRQFTRSLAKVDYLTLRHGFISAHMSSTRCNTFNFQKYIQKSLEEDFKLVVGIGPLMWVFAVIFLLVDVHDWHVDLWISYVPLLLVLVLGTKLESIVGNMAIQIDDRTTVIKGTPLVQPSDNLFWFRRPRLVLYLLHLTLFMNAFELAFFIWASIQFGVNSCYNGHAAITIARVVIAIVVQVLCSYITLPLYALVTQLSFLAKYDQFWSLDIVMSDDVLLLMLRCCGWWRTMMGSEFRSKALEELMAKTIKQWHAAVRERRKKEQSTRASPTDLSCLRKPTSMASESVNNHLNNYKGEITEERANVNNEEGASSSSSLSLAFMLEMQTGKRE